jgi:RNA polymerase sigma-70 factor (ECF subfamily)
MATVLGTVDRSAPAQEGDSGAGNSLLWLQAATDASVVADEKLEAGVRPESTGRAVDLVGLVARIKCDDSTGMEELYQLLTRGFRFHLLRNLGVQEMDDKVHDTFLIVVRAIRRGKLREPERLMGFVRTVVRRQVAEHINRTVQRRRDDVHRDVVVRVADMGRNPEQNQAHRQEVEFMGQVLRELSNREREILTRYYLLEETKEQIRAGMGLTETQFRLLKTRAKNRFGDLGKRRLQHPEWQEELL